jgi:hypothetical protein
MAVHCCACCKPRVGFCGCNCTAAAAAAAAAAVCAGEDPDYSADRVRASIKASMQRLGVEYIDILHCHDIEFCPDMRQVSGTTAVALRNTCVCKIGRAGNHRQGARVTICDDTCHVSSSAGCQVAHPAAERLLHLEAGCAAPAAPNHSKLLTFVTSAYCDFVYYSV